VPIGNECLRWSWFKDFENSFLQMIADDVGVRGRVHRFKFVFLAEAVELGEQRGLLPAEAVVHVVAWIEIHFGFPVVESPGKNYGRQ
jgi:hypothetical protein